VDFDTTGNGNNGRRSGRFPDFSTGSGRQRPSRRHRVGPDDDTRGDFRIPAGSRKAALVYLALAAWCEGLLDPKGFGEVRGRDVDEAGVQRALYRSSIGEIEHVIGPLVKGRRIVVEGHLAGAGRSALERLGASVEELRL